MKSLKITVKKNHLVALRQMLAMTLAKRMKGIIAHDRFDVVNEATIADRLMPYIMTFHEYDRVPQRLLTLFDNQKDAEFIQFTLDDAQAQRWIELVQQEYTVIDVGPGYTADEKIGLLEACRSMGKEIIDELKNARLAAADVTPNIFVSPRLPV